MSLLAIDVGNTNTVLGLYEGEELTHSWRIKTDPRATADEMALILRGLLHRTPEITGIALCSTVPAVLHEMRTMLTGYYDDVPTVIVEPGTLLATALGTTRPSRCHSWHHQAVARLGDGLHTSAAAPDGTIEAIEHGARRWVIGVQWHPEDDAATTPDQQRLFDTFVSQARVSG